MSNSKEQSQHEEKRQINLLPFIVEAFGCNPTIYKDIDKLYETRKHEFYKAAKKSELYTHQIVTEGILIQEEYCKKALGILLVLTGPKSKKDDYEKLTSIIRKGWTYAYLFVKNNAEIDLGKFIRRAVSKAGGIHNVSDDWLNSQMLIAYFLSFNHGKKIVPNEWCEKFESSLVARWDHYNNTTTRISLKNIPKELHTKVKELKKRIYEQYGHFTSYSKMYGLLAKRAEAMALLFDYEKLSCESLFSQLKFTERDIEEILLTYLVVYDYDSVNIESVADYLCDAVYVRYMIKAYKDVKKQYFDNNKELVMVELESTMKELAAAKQEVSYRSSLLSESEETIRTLEKEIQRLKVALEEERKNQQELNSLREFLFSLNHQQDNYTEDSELYDIENIKSIKAVLLGGHEKWQAKMKEVLPNFIFIHPDNLNYDLRVLDNIDALFIYPYYLNHSIYYRTMESIAGKDIIIGYLNETNEERVLQAISNTLSK